MSADPDDRVAGRKFHLIRKLPPYSENVFQLLYENMNLYYKTLRLIN